MKQICKSSEPPELIEYRQRFATQFRRWRDLKTNRKTFDTIRDRLAADQKGLCAYCEISLDSQDRSVEHFIPCSQSSPEQNFALDWQNMLATCRGGLQDVQVPGENALRNSRPPDNFPCCGAAKADFVPDGQLLNPLKLPSTPIFRFSSLDGTVSPDKTACEQAGVAIEQAQFTIDKLNLNVQRLKDQRLIVIDEAISRLDELDDGLAAPVELEAELAADYFGDGSSNWPKFFSALRFALGEGAERHLFQIM